MRLCVVHHLQAMLHLAVRTIKPGQLRRHLCRNPAFCGQRSQPANRRPVTQRWIPPPGNQLARLGEELDLADAPDTKFQVMPLHANAMQPAMIANAQTHVMRILDRHKIQMLAPDKRHQPLQEPRTRRQIAAARPRFDVSRAFPGSARAFIIAFRSRHRQTHRCDTGIRAQAQIGAKDITIRHVRQHGRHFTRHADESRPRLVFLARITGFVEQADQVDVRGIIQLPCPHLAHRQRNHPRRRGHILRPCPRQLAKANLVGHQRHHSQMHRLVSQGRQRAGDLLQLPDAAQIGQCRQQCHPPFRLPQGRGQSGQRQLRHRQQRLQCRFGVCQRLIQPSRLAQHQRFQVGAARRRCRQKGRHVRAKPWQGGTCIGRSGRIKGDGQPGDAGRKGHRHRMGRAGGAVNVPPFRRFTAYRAGLCKIP